MKANCNTFSMSITTKQLEALQVIDLIREVEGRNPSFQEIADELHVSKRAAVKRLESLRDKGWVEWTSEPYSLQRVNRERWEQVQQEVAELRLLVRQMQLQIGDNVNQEGEND